MLYLIRHAEAVDTMPDEARELSERGRGQVRTLARGLGRGKAFAPAEVWHSPLVRARETATLLVRELALAAPLRSVAGLTPADDPRIVAARVAGLAQPLAVVGHEPHLGALASLLVTGAADPVVFLMKKGAVLALEPAGRRWAVRWHVHPGLFE